MAMTYYSGQTVISSTELYCDTTCKYLAFILIFTCIGRLAGVTLSCHCELKWSCLLHINIFTFLAVIYTFFIFSPNVSNLDNCQLSSY